MELRDLYFQWVRRQMENGNYWLVALVSAPAYIFIFWLLWTSKRSSKK